jgi:hypothetical protein
MKRIFVPSQGIEDWKCGLAEPESNGRQAIALASSWEAAQGMPKEILALYLGRTRRPPRGELIFRGQAAKNSHFILSHMEVAVLSSTLATIAPDNGEE